MQSSRQNLLEPAWNLPELLSRVDHDEQLLRELLVIFREDFPRILQSLQTAVACADLKKAASASHTLKGMLSNLGGTRAAAAAAHLEALASREEASSLPAALAALEREAANLMQETNAYTDEVRG